jgi:hypothetical protein
MPKSQSKTALQSTGDNGVVGQAPPERPGGKLGVVITLLSRWEGARLDELMVATGWQAHSVRGALSGSIKKKRGVSVISEKVDGVRVYRIAAEVSE